MVTIIIISVTIFVDVNIGKQLLAALEANRMSDVNQLVNDLMFSI